MPEDHLRYDLLVREAMRGVVRRVLTDVAQHGLPGEHHLYVSFDTRSSGVRLSPRLRAQYPDEMTIVLQHQFWDLQITDTGIEVGLSFGGVPERLSVPFTALKGFFDPSVQFGLEFEVVAEPAAADGDDDAAAMPSIGKLPEGKRPEGAKLSVARPAAEAGAPREGRATKSKRGIQAAAELAAASGAAANSGAAKPETESDNDDPPTRPDGSGGGEVVRLDRFRKK